MTTPDTPSDTSALPLDVYIEDNSQQATYLPMLTKLRALLVQPVVVALLTAIALILLSFSAFAFKPTSDPSANVGIAFVLMLGGGLFLSAAIYLNVRGKFIQRPDFAFSTTETVFPAAYTLVTILGVALLLIEAEISGKGLHISWLHRVSYEIQGILFWVGVLLVAIGMAGRTGLIWFVNVFQRVRKLDPYVLALIGVIVFAFFLRAWNLEGSLPLSIDDGVNIPPAFPFLADTPDAGLITSTGAYQTTQVYAQLLSINIRLFGFNLTGARMTNVWFGTLNVVAIYFLASALFDRKMGLISALILATFPPHLHFSRLIFLHMADATFGTFAIAFLVRGMKYNRRSDWAWAGISLGLTQYFFEAGRLFYPPLIIMWLALIALTNFKKLRSLGRGIGIFLVTAVIIAIPTYYAALEFHRPVTSRLATSGLGLSYWLTLAQTGGLPALITRISLPFLAYVHYPETALYYAGNHPMVLEYLVPIFFLGAIYLLWSWRKPSVIVMLWLLTTSGANLLMQSSVEFPRFIVGFPTVAITIAAGIYYVIPMLFASLKITKFLLGVVMAIAALIYLVTVGYSAISMMTVIGIYFVAIVFFRTLENRRVLPTVTIALVGLVCVLQTNYYFNEQLPALKLQIRTQTPAPDAIDAARRMATMPPNTQAYLISDSTADPAIVKAFLALYRWNQPLPYLYLDVLIADEITPDFLKSLSVNRDYAFFVEPPHAALIDMLKSVFVLDEPKFTEEKDMPPNKGFVLYYAPLNKQAQPTPDPN